MSSTSAWWVVVALGLAGAVGTASVGPSLGGLQPEGDGPFTEGRLTDAAGVRAVLEANGYEPEVVSEQEWRISRKHGEWTVEFFVMLNADASVLWIKCYLGRLERAAEYRTEHYLDLLKAQGDISPRFFFTVPLEGGSADLWYCRGLDNRGLTERVVGDEIATAHRVMEECIGAWNFTKWQREGEGGGEDGR